jgi:hypothetical protein
MLEKVSLSIQIHLCDPGVSVCLTIANRLSQLDRYVFVG